VLLPVPSSPSKVMNFPRRDILRNDSSVHGSGSLCGYFAAFAV
jgi:hypothetical protein